MADERISRITLDRPLPGFLAARYLISDLPVRILGIKARRLVYEFPNQEMWEKALGMQDLCGARIAGIIKNLK